MADILTREQVKAIREKYEPQERLAHYELRTLLLEVLDNYDAQGVQLADAIARHSEAERSLVWTQGEAQRLQEDLIASQADVRALAEVLRTIKVDDLHCQTKILTALARPGVVMLNKKEVANG